MYIYICTYVLLYIVPVGRYSDGGEGSSRASLFIMQRLFLRVAERYLFVMSDSPPK